MKLIRFETSPGSPRWGALRNELVHPLPGDGVQAAMGLLVDPSNAGGARTEATVALRDLTYLPPLLPEATIYCVGFNYKSHVEETMQDLPPFPALFIRTAASLVGHGQALQRPSWSDAFDYEGEVAVVIGQSGRNLHPEEAMRYVAGYTCFNDGSIRDYQKHSPTAGKNFDCSGAIGPWIVTSDEMAEQTRIALRTRLNGTEVQASDLSMLIYSLADVVSYISRFAQLCPGDVIATGTPAGVGARRTPPLWMKPGDVVEVEAGGVGILSNRVEAAT